MAIKVSQMENVNPLDIEPMYTKEEAMVALAKIVNYGRKHGAKMTDAGPFVIAEVLYSILYEEYKNTRYW
jgi:hypothetical protein